MPNYYKKLAVFYPNLQIASDYHSKTMTSHHWWHSSSQWEPHSERTPQRLVTCGDGMPDAFLCWRIPDSQKSDTLYLSLSLCPVFSVSFRSGNCLSEFSSDGLFLLHSAGLFWEIATLKSIWTWCIVWHKHFPGLNCCFFGPLFPFHELKDLGFSDGLWDMLLSRSLSWAQANIFE